MNLANGESVVFDKNIEAKSESLYDEFFMCCSARQNISLGDSSYREHKKIDTERSIPSISKGTRLL